MNQLFLWTVFFTAPSIAFAFGLEEAANALFNSINSVISQVIFFNVLFFTDSLQLPLAVAWLSIAAVYLTFQLKFVNVRYFKHAIDLTRGVYDTHKAKGEVSHFKALATALSATLGLGNIAGVAVAISTGGPGATFWIIIAGLFGMSSKFAECTLAQMYRVHRPDGHVLGGPMLYLQEGLKKYGWARTGQALAILFSLLCICGAFGGGGSLQVNQSLFALAEVMPEVLDYKWVYGLVMSFLVGIVIIGGIRRIANVAEKVVPFMCGIYILMALYVLAVNASAIPAAFTKIIVEAFAPEAVYGGFLGTLVIGIRRAAFSNEAGMGSAAIAHSAAKTEHPVEEGVVALLEPFIDTVVVCTITALVLVITGAYNNPAYIDLIHAKNGSGLTSRAVGEAHVFFPYLLAVIVFLFAYSTIISWSYYGERAFVFLAGEQFSIVYRVTLVVVLFLGAVTTSTNMMEFGDLMILGLAFPNLIGVFFLRKEISAQLADYRLKLAQR